MKPGHVVYVRIDPRLKSAAGRELWATEGWYTMNQIPKGKPVPTRKPSGRPAGLSASERRAGFRLLFDGRTMSGWRGFRKDHVPTAWSPRNGELTLTPGTGDGGDIMTAETFGDFDFRCEWKVAPRGNSGIFYRVTQEHSVPWGTGPEMQILDDAGHPDGRNPLTSAGSCYALYPAPRGVVRPGGEWNESRLVIRNNHVEHWLNGQRVVSYVLGSEAWKADIKKSKFASLPDHGMRARGHLVFQDHGDPVSYRNLRIRRLGP
jgi:hypothetical protein